MQERIATLDNGSVKDKHNHADGTIEVATGYTSSCASFSELFDNLGNLASYAFNTADGLPISLTGSDIGTVLGSSIGNEIEKRT